MNPIRETKLNLNFYFLGQVHQWEQVISEENRCQRIKKSRFVLSDRRYPLNPQGHSTMDA